MEISEQLALSKLDEQVACSLCERVFAVDGGISIRNAVFLVQVLLLPKVLSTYDTFSVVHFFCSIARHGYADYLAFLPKAIGWLLTESRACPFLRRCGSWSSLRLAACSKPFAGECLTRLYAAYLVSRMNTGSPTDSYLASTMTAGAARIMCPFLTVILLHARIYDAALSPATATRSWTACSTRSSAATFRLVNVLSLVHHLCS